MTYAHWLGRLDQQSPAQVVEIAGGTSRWFSTIPLAAKAEAVPLLEPFALPARELPLTGGGSKVHTLTFRLVDVKSAYWKVTSLLYSRALVGSPVRVWQGYAVDTAWNTTNFPMVWAGVITDYQWDGGGWTVTCEDYLGRVKAATIGVPEFTADLQTALTGTAVSLVLQNCVGDLTATANTDLLGGTGDFEDAGDVALWVSNNEGAGADPVISQSSTQKHGGTYSMKAIIPATVSDLMTLTHSDGGNYIPLPAGHMPGDSYGVKGWWMVDMNEGDPVSRISRVTLCVYGITAGGTVQEYAVVPGGTRFTSDTPAWNSQSVTITVYHPDTVALKVVWEYSTAAVNADALFYFDDITVRKTSAFLALGNEILGVESFDAATCTATVSRGAIGTLQGSAAIGDKVRRVTPFCGFGGDIILRALTTTSAGTNGDWDYGDGLGCGIPTGMVDEAALEALRGTYTYHVFAIVADKPPSDALKWLDDEVLAPWGGSMVVSNRGLLTAKFVPDSVSSATHALTDADMSARPTVKCSTSEIINTVYVEQDYDLLDAVKTGRDSNPATERQDVGTTTKGKYNRDPKYIAFYQFDEQDHRTDFVYKDQGLTSQATFGQKLYALKSKSVRGLYSAQLSMPVLRFNYGSEYLVQKGEEMARHLAQRLITYYNSPVHTVTASALVPFSDVEPGDTASITSDYLPDLDPTTGGRVGITAAKGFVRAVRPGRGTVTLDVVVTDWAEAVADDQDAYVAPTDPGATNVGVTWVTSADFTTGVYEAAPKSNVNALRILHNYGAVACTLPSTNKWARTEVRRYLCNALGYSTAARTGSIGVIVAGPAASSVSARSSKVLWLFKDGTYSTAYTVTV